MKANYLIVFFTILTINVHVKGWGWGNGKTTSSTPSTQNATSDKILDSTKYTVDDNTTIEVSTELGRTFEDTNIAINNSNETVNPPQTLNTTSSSLTYHNLIDIQLNQLNPEKCLDSMPAFKMISENNKKLNARYVIHGIEFYPYKMVIRVHVPKFIEQCFLINNNYINQNNFNNIIMDNSTINDFKSFLEYFFDEELKTIQDFNFNKGLIELSERYQLEKLRANIDQSLIHAINLKNFVDIFNFAFNENLKPVIKYWREFVANNSEIIIKEMLYLTKSDHIMECIVVSLGANQTQLIHVLKEIKEYKPEFDIKRLNRTLVLSGCSLEDLQSLVDFGLINNIEIFNEISKRYSKNSNHNKRFDKTYTKLDYNDVYKHQLMKFKACLTTSSSCNPLITCYHFLN